MRRLDRMSRGAGIWVAAAFALVALAGTTPAPLRGQAHVTLILSDSHTEATAAVIRALHEEDRSLGDRIRFHLFPTDPARVDLAALRASRLVVANVHQTDALEALRAALEERVAADAAVYAVGGTPLEEQLGEAGFRFDPTVYLYYEQGGPENLRNLILFLLARELGEDVVAAPPRPMPEEGIFDPHTDRVFHDYEAYVEAYEAYRPDRPWVGLTVLRTYVISGQTRHVRAMAEALEERGLNVLTIFGHPEPPNLERWFFDEAGAPRVSTVVAMSLRLGVDPDALGPVLERLDAPVLNAISLSNQSAVEWREDPTGIGITERGWQVANPELGGLVAPTVVAAKEPRADPALGLEVLEYRPIEEGVERVADRAAALVRLGATPAAERRVAMIYYNYPPGKENVGASYLNVLPGSLSGLLAALDSAGYDVGGRSLEPDSIFERVTAVGRNAGPWTGGELDRLVGSGEPVMVPVRLYRDWFEKLPGDFRRSVVEQWGEPEEGRIMTWTDPDGESFLVLPAVWFGNTLLTAQPLRAAPMDGSGAHGAGMAMDSATHSYHDLALPPHHQYVAFYLWLRHEWDAHAVVHVGTHGTHEWLPGKEVGLDEDDAPEVLIGDLPNIYLYIVDDVGEGLQAKRRGMATVVDHLTPPFDRAELEGGLADLQAMIDDWNVATDRSGSVAEVRRAEINAALLERGILTDLGMDSVRTDMEMEAVEHHLRAIGNADIPYGLHEFGRSPSPELARTTAEAMAARDDASSEAELEAKIHRYEEDLLASGPRELASFLAALDGRYVPAGAGNDPLRNPESVPTGKNFFAFNPSRIPSGAVFARGAELADSLVADYRARNDRWPDRLTYTLWSTETLRHEGLVEGQVLRLLGMRPRYDPRGNVGGVEAVPREELGRPRVDVTVITSGLYRDLFSNLLQLLDGAVEMAAALEEEDNQVRIKTLAAERRLLEEGVSEEMAARLARARIFGVPKGAYGANLEDAILASDQWEEEGQIATLFLGRMSHVYGQGFWGDRPEEVAPELSDRDGFSVDLLRGALAGTDVAVHSRSSNLYATLDNDDFYQYLGGAVMAISSVDGTAPEVVVSDLTNPGSERQETLARFMGRELRARYLNPKWIEGMIAEGYSGARFMSRVVSNLWGWQVTVPDVVDDAKWNEMYATYVEDRNGLGLDEWFSQQEHAWAYQTIVARMLETSRRGYWDAPAEVVARLTEELVESIEAAGAACNALVCNNAPLLAYAMENLEAAPGAALATAIAEARGAPLLATDVVAEAAELAGDPTPAPASADAEPTPEAEPAGVEEALADAAPRMVQGFEMVERAETAPPVTSQRALVLLRTGFLLLLGALAVGWGTTGVSRRPRHSL